MKCFNKFILALTMTAVSGQVMAADACQHKNEFTNYVNPWIGTGGHGHVFLGANVPFGVVQLGPTEHTHGWDWCSGYHISDSVLVGFGHTHLSGTGIGDLGDIGFLPVAHCCATETKFSHANESVRPGYYAIRLQEPNVFVELTATKRVGFKIINQARMEVEKMYDNNNQSRAVNWRWRVEGDITEIPRALRQTGYNWLGSDRFVEDGSFIRLNYSQLSYSLPSKTIKKWGLTQLSFHVSANNLFVLTKYSGADPEVGYGSMGIVTDGAKTPRAKSFTGGITIRF